MKSSSKLGQPYDLQQTSAKSQVGTRSFFHSSTPTRKVSVANQYQTLKKISSRQLDPQASFYKDELHDSNYKDAPLPLELDARVEQRPAKLESGVSPSVKVVQRSTSNIANGRAQGQSREEARYSTLQKLESQLTKTVTAASAVEEDAARSAKPVGPADPDNFLEVLQDEPKLMQQLSTMFSRNAAQANRPRTEMTEQRSVSYITL